jgi:Amt family ammonium transporter
MFDHLRLDDPVGALSVHLVNGIFGTICVGLFAQDKITGTPTGNGLFYGGGFKLLGAQLASVVSAGLFVFITAMITWAILKVVIGIRVSREEELRGLDIGEHGNEAYAGFQVFTTA